MGYDRKTRLAIKTVVVTTLAAVQSHGNSGHEQLGRDSADRGLALLDALESRLPARSNGEVGRLLEEARGRLEPLSNRR